MGKELTQDWLDWILENIQRGCDRSELLEILCKEGFDQTQSKIALGFEINSTDVTYSVDETNRNKSIKSKSLSISFDPIREEGIEMYEIDNFLNETECAAIVEVIKSKLRPSEIASNNEYDDSFRTSSTCDLGNLDLDILKDLDRRICELIGINQSYSEIIQGQHYEVGQEFKAHTDYFEGDQINEFGGQRGQRTYTFMIYLNDVTEGGETEFYQIDRKIKPSLGKAVIWNNLDKNGSPNPKTLHHAHPVLEGSKTVITKWFRENGEGIEQISTLNKDIRNYTVEGFKKTTLNKNLYNELIDFYIGMKGEAKQEHVEGNFIQSKDSDSPSNLIELSEELKDKIHKSLHKSLEEWSETKLIPTFVYGIRDYKKGSVLVPHRDREKTHIISAIINIDQDLEEEWPLVIEDHYYRRHQIYLQPGEVIFYEGAKLLHGRPDEMQGTSYANIFCHFMPDERMIS
tara:strand:+ start:2107 stop:3483 length:1377 start_codon:yes stop_codon:yes gene_type:complete